MIKRPGCVLVLACAALAASARPAQAQQTLNVSWGRSTMPAGGRVETDILLIEHADLVFDIKDFNGATFGGEWLVPIGNLFEAGAGVSFSRRAVRAVYGRVTNSDGSEIPRDLGLRRFPMALTARVLPLGQSYRVQPYAGGGVALISWRFSESGDFVDERRAVVREAHDATGVAVGPVLLLGLRVAGDTVALGFETRYQRARGSFGPSFARVRDPDIDLGGWTLQLTAGLRLGE